jgi:hypothetical protein
MVEMAQKLELSERALGIDFGVEDVADLLDGHQLPFLGIVARAVRKQGPKQN